MNNPEIRQLAHVRNDEIYFFRYKSGEEDRLIRSMSELALNPNLDFDWSDRDLLSYCIRRKIKSG